MSATQRTERFLAITFLVLVFAPGLVQLVMELRRGEHPRVMELFDRKPTAKNLRAYEQGLDDALWLSRHVRPWLQYGHFALGDAGEKALVGRDGWLFYKPGFRYLTERIPPHEQWTPTNSPVAAIVAFRDELANGGMELVVMPAPNKESIYPAKLSGRWNGSKVLIASQTQRLMDELRKEGVHVVDLFALYRGAKEHEGAATNEALYLAQDSHWSPVGLDLAAQAMAKKIQELRMLPTRQVEYREKVVPVQRRGDIVRMLQVPQIENSTVPEAIECRQIVDTLTSAAYQDDPNSPVLVLGDSFLRIFEKDAPKSAGFIAHLARHLGYPVTSLVNDGGASTLVRQELYRRPALLTHKRIVVWEFVERDIRFGTEGWQVVPLPPLTITGIENRPAKSGAL